MGLRPLEICLLLQRGGRHWSSESDVYRFGKQFKIDVNNTLIST